MDSSRKKILENLVGSLQIIVAVKVYIKKILIRDDSSYYVEVVDRYVGIQSCAILLIWRYNIKVRMSPNTAVCKLAMSLPIQLKQSLR